jgi:hypothetical protein
LDHKRVRREEENKLEAANNEITVLKGRLDEMAREAAREREALDKAWQRKLNEAEVLVRIAIKEARHSGTTGVAEELAAIAFETRQLLNQCGRDTVVDDLIPPTISPLSSIYIPYSSIT